MHRQSSPHLHHGKPATLSSFSPAFPTPRGLLAICPSTHPCNTLPLTQLQSTALKSVRSIAPLLDRILVQRVKAEAKTAGGIFLPESAQKELNQAEVLAVGPGALNRDGARIAPSLKAGDKVLIPQVCAR